MPWNSLLKWLLRWKQQINEFRILSKQVEPKMTWPLLSLVFAQVQFHLWPCQQLLLLASDPLDWLPRCHVTNVHHNKLRQQWSMDNMGTPHTTYPFLPFLPRTIGFLMTPLNFTWVWLANIFGNLMSRCVLKLTVSPSFQQYDMFISIIAVWKDILFIPFPCCSPQHSQQTCFNRTILTPQKSNGNDKPQPFGLCLCVIWSKI